MDISKGIVEIDNELVVKPNFTFEQFKETKYYTNQDGIRIIYLDGPQIIKNRKYIVSLFFRDGKIYMLSLICCDEEYSEKDESKRKDLMRSVFRPQKRKMLPSSVGSSPKVPFTMAISPSIPFLRSVYPVHRYIWEKPVASLSILYHPNRSGKQCRRSIFCDLYCDSAHR